LLWIIHDEAEAQKRAHRTSAYYPHTDKFGSVALFLQLDGISFTFVALPGGATDEVKFDKDSDHFLRYKQWKAHASMEDSIALYQFERDFQQRAKQRRQMRVQVYELLAGQRLCFAAGQYLHASIIPAQVKGTLRSLLIFHARKHVYPLLERAFFVALFSLLRFFPILGGEHVILFEVSALLLGLGGFVNAMAGPI
jgi:hypothetical protein